MKVTTKLTRGGKPQTCPRCGGPLTVVTNERGQCAEFRIHNREVCMLCAYTLIEEVMPDVLRITEPADPKDNAPRLADPGSQTA